MGGGEKGKRKRYNDGLQVMTPWPVIELARQCHDPRQLLALQKFQARAAAGHDLDQVQSAEGLALVAFYLIYVATVAGLSMVRP